MPALPGVGWLRFCLGSSRALDDREVFRQPLFRRYRYAIPRLCLCRAALCGHGSRARRAVASTTSSAAASPAPRTPASPPAATSPGGKGRRQSQGHGSSSSSPSLPHLSSLHSQASPSPPPSEARRVELLTPAPLPSLAGRGARNRLCPL